MKLLNKNTFDQILYGKNIYSILFGIDQLSKSKGNVIIDDKRFNYGDHLTGEIDYIEKCYMNKWCHENRNIINIDNYIESIEENLILNNTLIKFCNNAYENLIEIQRKLFPFDDLIVSSYTEKKFNEEILEFSKSFADYFYHINNFNNLKFDLVLKKMSKNLQSLYQDFCSTDKSDILISLGNIKKFSRLSLSVSSFEKLYIFIDLFIPKYRLKRKAFEQDLIKIYKDKHGDIISTKINHWEHNENKWTVGIERFEGVLFTKQLFFLGNNIETLNIDLKKKKGTFRHLTLRLKKLPHDYYDFERSTYYISDDKLLGTDLPYLKVVFLEEMVQVSTLIPNLNCDKMSFIETRYSNRIFSLLNNIFQDFEFLYSDFYWEQGFDLAIDESFNYKRNNNDLSLKKYELMNYNNSSEKTMNNSIYFGQKRQLPLGKLGLFWELRNVSRFT